MEILKLLKTSGLLFIMLIAMTGLIYPAIVTLFSQLAFPYQANGSLIVLNENVIGSELIGQDFSDPKYFWSRPSATMPFPYNAELSSGSNLGPTNPLLLTQIQARIATLKNADAQNKMLIPVGLVTASGSGLDPDITPISAVYQAYRIAEARGILEYQVHVLINNAVQKPALFFLGRARVNVLQLNLALDALPPSTIIKKIPAGKVNHDSRKTRS